MINQKFTKCFGRSKTMSGTLTLNLDQLKSAIKECNIEEKIELVNYLENETFEVRFRNLLSILNTSDLTLDEITKEVEAVR